MFGSTTQKIRAEQFTHISQTTDANICDVPGCGPTHLSSPTQCNRSKTSKGRLLFLIYFLHILQRRRTIHVLCAMIQRSGPSTCGYHLLNIHVSHCVARARPRTSHMSTLHYGKGLSREPYRVIIAILPALLPQSGICIYFLLILIALTMTL